MKKAIKYSNQNIISYSGPDSDQDEETEKLVPKRKGNRHAKLTCKYCKTEKLWRSDALIRHIKRKHRGGPKSKKKGGRPVNSDKKKRWRGNQGNRPELVMKRFACRIKRVNWWKRQLVLASMLPQLRL